MNNVRLGLVLKAREVSDFGKGHEPVASTI